MAINPETQYPGKIKPSSLDYPYGEARNITTPGDGTGTPWEAALLNDIFGFQQALLSEASVVPSGTPEKVTASQYLQSVYALSGRIAPTLEDVSAKDGTIDGEKCFLTDSNRGGPFIWRPGNFSAEVTFDTEQGVYIAPDSDPTGASGAWVREYFGAILVVWFGAVGDDTTDSTTGIQAAHNFVRAYGSVLLWTEGSYVVSDTIIADGNNWTWISDSQTTGSSTGTATASDCPVKIRSTINNTAKDVVALGSAANNPTGFLRGITIDGIAIIGSGNERDGLHWVDTDIASAVHTMRECNFRNMHAELCGRDGIRLEGHTYLSNASNIMSRRNGRNGYHLTGGTVTGTTHCFGQGVLFNLKAYQNGQDTVTYPDAANWFMSGNVETLLIKPVVGHGDITAIDGLVLEDVYILDIMSPQLEDNVNNLVTQGTALIFNLNIRGGDMFNASGRGWYSPGSDVRSVTIDGTNFRGNSVEDIYLGANTQKCRILPIGNNPDPHSVSFTDLGFRNTVDGFVRMTQDGFDKNTPTTLFDNGLLVETSFASFATSQTVTQTGPQVIQWSNTAGANLNITPTGTFYQGAWFEIKNAGVADNFIFDPAGLNAAILPGKTAKVVYDGANWKTHFLV